MAVKFILGCLAHLRYSRVVVLVNKYYRQQKNMPCYLQCTAIYMLVIAVRTELINWYIRHGYRDTGERKPFVEDNVTGKHLQPLEFMTLESQCCNLWSDEQHVCT